MASSSETMKSMIREMRGDASFEAPKYLPNIQNWTSTEVILEFIFIL